MEVSQLAVLPFWGPTIPPVRAQGNLHPLTCLPVLPLMNVTSLGEGDCLGSGLGEIVESSCPPTLGIGVRVMD